QEVDVSKILAENNIERLPHSLLDLISVAQKLCPEFTPFTGQLIDPADAGITKIMIPGDHNQALVWIDTHCLAHIEHVCFADSHRFFYARLSCVLFDVVNQIPSHDH